MQKGAMCKWKDGVSGCLATGKTGKRQGIFFESGKTGKNVREFAKSGSVREFFFCVRENVREFAKS